MRLWAAMACGAMASANSDAGDVHRNDDDDLGEIPFLLDIQANLLADLQTRVIVPLIRAGSFGRRAVRLHPPFTIDGQDLVMASLWYESRTLGSAVASLQGERDVVFSAIDFFGGVGMSLSLKRSGLDIANAGRSSTLRASVPSISNIPF